MTSKRLSIRLFGPPAFTWRGQKLDVPTRKATALLCYVTLRGGTPRADLTELLWGVGQHSNLRLELYRLRQLPGAASWFLTDTLIHIDGQTDVAGFEKALKERDFSRALSFYDGTANQLLLKDLEPKTAPAFWNWLELERRRVTALFCDALYGYTGQLEVAGKLNEALEVARQLLALDTLNESVHRTVMRLEWRLGNVEAAQRQFEQCRRILAVELGIAPLPETEVLATAIEHALRSDLHVPGLQRLPPELLRPPVLAGREREWQQLEAAWDQGQLIFIAGEAGVGKTRLVMDFVSQKTGGDFLSLTGRPGDTALPFSSIVRMFRSHLKNYPNTPETLEPWVRAELTRILPELHLTEPPPLIDQAARYHFFEAYYRMMQRCASSYPVIIGEDTHFYDNATFYEGESAILRTFVPEHSDPCNRARLINTFRPGEIDPERIAIMQALAEQGAALYLELRPLSLAATKDLLAGTKLSDVARHARNLHSLTAGNPQFITELLKTWYQQSDLNHADTFTFDDLSNVNNTIAKRLEQLSPKALHLVRALAVVQAPASAEVLMALLDLKAWDLAPLLAELEDRQILKDGLFVHDLIYETTLQRTPYTIKVMFHRRAAAWQIERAAGAATIANHLEAAQDFELALPWRVRAAEQALQAGSSEQARHWLESVLTHTAPETTLYQRAEELLRAAQLKS